MPDKEAAHRDADKVLAEFLRTAGHGELADVYQAAAENWFHG